MDNSQAHRDWLDDEHTREIVGKFKAELEAATKDLICKCETASIEDIRAAAGRRRAAVRSLRIVMGKPKHEDNEAE